MELTPEQQAAWDQADATLQDTVHKGIRLFILDFMADGGDLYSLRFAFHMAANTWPDNAMLEAWVEYVLAGE